MKTKVIQQETVNEIKNCILNATHQVPFIVVYDLLQKLDQLPDAPTVEDYKNE